MKMGSAQSASVEEAGGFSARWRKGRKRHLDSFPASIPHGRDDGSRERMTRHLGKERGDAQRGS